MATRLLEDTVTLADVQKEVDPKGEVADVVEVFNEVNEFLIDAHMEEANDLNSHINYIRSRMPSVRGGRKINSGADTASAAVTPERESIAILERWVAVDERIVKGSPDPQKTLSNQSRPILEQMMQEFSRQLIYGSEADDDTELTGLATRFNDTSDDNVHDFGGSGSDCASIWMIEWGPETCFLVYPRGAERGGIEHDDKGLIDWRDSSSKPFDAYVQKFVALFGLSVPDKTRGVQRGANVESSGSSNNIRSDEFATLIAMKNGLRHFGERNTIIYVNRDLKTQFDIAALEKNNGFYMQQNITGAPLTTFQGIPVRLSEQLLSTESDI